MGLCPKEGERLGTWPPCPPGNKKCQEPRIKSRSRHIDLLPHINLSYLCVADHITGNQWNDVIIYAHEPQIKKIQWGDVHLETKKSAASLKKPCLCLELIYHQFGLISFLSSTLQHKQPVEGGDVRAMGRQRQRGEPKQRLPPQGGLRPALGPGSGPRGALEMPVCGRQWKQHRPHARAQGRRRQAAGGRRERSNGECTAGDGQMSRWRMICSTKGGCFFFFFN